MVSKTHTKVCAVLKILCCSRFDSTGQSKVAVHDYQTSLEVLILLNKSFRSFTCCSVTRLAVQLWVCLKRGLQVCGSKFSLAVLQFCVPHQYRKCPPLPRHLQCSRFFGGLDDSLSRTVNFFVDLLCIKLSWDHLNQQIWI